MLPESEVSMSSKREWLKWGIIVTTLGAILFLHYFTYLTHGPLKYEHAVHRMLFYLPLVLGSFWFGLKGSLCVSGTVIVCNLPYAINSWQGLSPEDFDILLQALLFVLVGILLGCLVDREREQHRALIKAESLADVGKTVSEIAHDMKTPLMAIGGFTTQVLRDMRPDDQRRRKLEIAVKQTSRLEAMIREMLDFGRPLVLKRSKVNLNDLSRDAVELSQPLADRAQVSLKMDLDPSDPRLMLDSSRVNQVLVNLISNGVQASPIEEEVWVRTRSDNGAVFLEVSDRGCGIKPENRVKVFQPFFSTKETGTGLGLAVSKKIIETHGGKLAFSPNYPKGTTFTVCFPL
jgi:signal transduction histidine kinase